MHATFDAEHRTRMIFLGDAALADGFQLIGFETHVDPTPEHLERVLRGLEERQEKAFVVIGTACPAQQCAAYRRLRNEGGRVVISRVPPLAAPADFQCEVDQRVRVLLGGADQL
jgi:vacuolar-type H+-ATPase subunit F/Vma7